MYYKGVCIYIYIYTHTYTYTPLGPGGARRRGGRGRHVSGRGVPAGGPLASFVVYSMVAVYGIFIIVLIIYPT